MSNFNFSLNKQRYMHMTSYFNVTFSSVSKNFRKMELNFYIYEPSNEFFFVTLNCTHSLHGNKCLLRNKLINYVYDIFSRILNFLMLILYCLNFQGLFIFLVHVPLNKKVSDTVFAVPYQLHVVLEFL